MPYGCVFYKINTLIRIDNTGTGNDSGTGSSFLSGINIIHWRSSSECFNSLLPFKPTSHQLHHKTKFTPTLPWQNINTCKKNLDFPNITIHYVSYWTSSFCFKEKLLQASCFECKTIKKNLIHFCYFMLKVIKFLDFFGGRRIFVGEL